jgi:hypothetical protein
MESSLALVRLTLERGWPLGLQFLLVFLQALAVGTLGVSYGMTKGSAATEFFA